MLDWLAGRSDAHRFLTLPDGRTIFHPQGPWGRLYLVPDAETRLRLERRYALIDRTVKIATGVGLVLASLARLWFLIPLLILAGLLLPKWGDSLAVEALPEVHDDATLLAVRWRAARPGRWPWVVQFGGAAGALLFAIYLGSRSGGATADVVAMFTAGLIGLFAAMTELGESRPEELSHGYGDPPNDPIVPK